ncbi:MAG: tetratricopeptide repeat protein [Pseudomonadota bacterium]
MPIDLDADRLDSWKAIANYLGRSVRTARRWESEEGLPVHRHRHNTGGSVFAYREELERWRQSRHDQAAPLVAPPMQGQTDATIAVLPFNYLGADDSRAYIADGFTEETITALSRVPALRVISWTSSMTLKGSDQGARQIGRKLGASRLVEGTVRHEADRIRISARLVDVASDSQLWSSRFDGTLDGLFDIQDDMANAVVAALELQAASRPAPSAQPDLAAWQFLVQARQASLRWRKPAIEEAVALLEAGLAVAGDEPRLHAALGRTHLHYREAGIDFSEAPIQAAEASASRVAALAPGLAAGQQLEGWIHYCKAEIAEALAALRRAHAQEPWDPDTLAMLANCYLISGRVSEARPLIDTLCRIDPLTPLTRCMPGWADLLEGRFDAAVGPYQDMFDADPHNPFARLFLVLVLAAAGRRDAAQDLAVAVPPGVTASPPGQVLSLFAHALAGDGLPKLSPALTEGLASTSDVMPRFIGQAYAIAGDVAQATHWIGRAADRGFINYPYLADHDPFLTALPADPAWTALLGRVRRRWEAFPG